MNDDQTTIGPRGPGQSKGKVKKTSNYSYAFRQQILKAWQPVPTLASTVCIFTVLGKVQALKRRLHFFFIYRNMLFSFGFRIALHYKRYLGLKHKI